MTCADVCFDKTIFSAILFLNLDIDLFVSADLVVSFLIESSDSVDVAES